ncbi:MAG: hypothetical protein V2I46_08335 [Bacteroides sp.]|jgi:hypothetical protein|nr:hypothetical protein [Bacteroides sp.]
MKHILLFFFLFVGLVSSGFSEGLVLKDADGNDITNGTLTVHGSPSANYIRGQVFLHNDTESSLEIWARKIEEEVIPSTFNTFCWSDFCYDNSVFESQGALTLDAGATSVASDFYGQYFPEGYSGTTIIEYEFFSRSEAFETVSVTVHYTADATSASGPMLRQTRISDPRPNPARDFTLFDYQLPPDTRNAKLIVRNLTGSVVMDISLDPSGSRLRIETNDLSNGIFLYSFVVNDQVILTKKLVVSR